MNKNKNTKQALKQLTLSLIIGIALFLVVTPAITKAQQGSNLPLAINSVGTEPNANSFSQIYVVVNNEKKIITATNYTNSSPKFENDYVVWMGQKDNKWQIFMYNIQTEGTIQLTRLNNNANPHILNGIVFWEGQTLNSWQIFQYDGLRIANISENEGVAYSINSDSGYISYTKSDGKTAKKFLYNYIDETESEIIPKSQIETKNLDPEKQPEPEIEEKKNEDRNQEFTEEEIKEELNIETKEIEKDDVDEIILEEIIETLETTESTEAI